MHAAVVWANPSHTPELDSPSVPVWTLADLGAGLTRVSHGAPYPAETVQQIGASLKHLIERAGQMDDEGWPFCAIPRSVLFWPPSRHPSVSAFSVRMTRHGGAQGGVGGARGSRQRRDLQRGTPLHARHR